MRTEEFWIDKLDQYGNITGQFQPALGGQITAAAGKSIVRSLTGLILLPGETLPTNTRLRPVISIDGTETQLATFLPTLAARKQTDLGELTEINGHDLGFLLGQTLHTAYGVTLGASIVTAATDLVVLAGISDVTIPPLATTAGSYLAWPPGAPITDALDALMRLLGLTAAVDRTGTLVARNIPYIGVDAPVKSWQAGEASEMYPDAIELDDVWNIPNTWWVVSSTGQTPLAGKFELPDAHPMSFVSRGFRNTVVMQVAGLTSTAECEQRARDEAQRAAHVHNTVELTCALAPTLEPWDVVTYKDTDWIVESFTINLQVGAPMKVRLRESLAAA